MKVLYLTLNKKWFDMILLQLFKPEEAKYEEYRGLKDYWIKRFKEMSLTRLEAFKHFDYIEFSNGYSPKSRKMVIEFKGFEVGQGKEEWGAEKGVDYFKLKLGKITDTKNCFTSL